MTTFVAPVRREREPVFDAGDLLSGERSYHDDPYPVYEEIRSVGPIVWARDLDTWIVVGAELTRDLLTDGRLTNAPSAGNEFEAWLSRSRDSPRLPQIIEHVIFMLDGPQHRAVRGVLAPHFSAAAIHGRRARVETIVADLAAEFPPPGIPFDFMERFAIPLPAHVLCDHLGIPREDWPELVRFSYGLSWLLEWEIPARARLKVGRSVVALTRYLETFLAGRHGEGPAAAMVAAARQGTVQPEAVIPNLILLFGAGHITTTNMLGNGVLSLLRDDTAWASLVEQPDRRARWGEEILRYEPPVQFALRVALEDLDVAGAQVRAGDRVVVLLAAALRDPASVADPATFRPRDSQPRTLAFGVGTHFCIGAVLARMQWEVASAALANLAPGLRLAGAATWRDTVSNRGLAVLPVCVDSTSRAR